jgi:hypothetical protein
MTRILPTGLASVSRSSDNDCREQDKRARMKESVLTCPKCGHAKREVMPEDACQYFYECEACKEVLRPKAGDCCVFCSYGSAACPSKTATSR